MSSEAMPNDQFPMTNWGRELPGPKHRCMFRAFHAGSLDGGHSSSPSEPHGSIRVSFE